MQGDIRVKSKPGRGSNFIVAFPVVVAEEVVAISGAAGGEDTIPGASVLRGKSYLLLDDVAENTFILAASLKRFGVRSTVTQNGIAALEEFKGQPQLFDGVITDLRMPLMSGQTFIQEIRKFEREKFGGPKVPIVVMTAEAAVDEKRLCLTQYGANDYLLKPVKLRELISALVRVHTSADQERARHKQVLIVDDDAVGSRFVAVTLSKAGHRCRQALTVREGREMLDEGECDILILDGLLGDGSGVDFMRGAGAMLEKKRTRVISVSGNAVEDQRRMYEGAGRIAGYMQKPIRRQELLGLVQIL